MQTSLYNKGLVLIIIMLFVGAGIIPIVGAINAKKLNHKNNAQICFATIIYVDDDSECPGDGSIEWPYCKIQDGIEHVINGDTIHVANGTYYENIFINNTLYLIGGGLLAATLVITWLLSYIEVLSGDEKKIWKAFERYERTGTRVMIIVFQIFILLEVFY